MSKEQMAKHSDEIWIVMAGFVDLNYSLGRQNPKIFQK